MNKQELYELVPTGSEGVAKYTESWIDNRSDSLKCISDVLGLVCSLNESLHRYKSDQVINKCINDIVIKLESMKIVDQEG